MTGQPGRDIRSEKLRSLTFRAPWIQQTERGQSTRPAKQKMIQTKALDTRSGGTGMIRRKAGHSREHLRSLCALLGFFAVGKDSCEL